MRQSTFLSREPAWSGGDFVGRSSALAWVAGQLGRETPQNCNIVGEPRIGKSSVLYAVYRNKIGLPGGYRGIYVWVRLVEWADRQPDAFWMQLLGELREAAGRAGLGLPPASINSGATAWEAYRTIESLLEHLQANERGLRVIVLVDDFELMIPGITGQGLDWLRALATRFATLFALVIATTDPLEQVCRPLAEEQVSPLPNIFATYHLGLLSEAETQALIESAPECEGQPPFSPELARFLRQEAGRHPDLLKLGCAHLLQVQREEGDLIEPAEVMEAARSDIRYDANARWLCERLLARRTAEEREVLAALTDGGAGGDPILLRRLERKLGLVEQRETGPALFADTFAYWLRRRSATAPAGGEASAKPAPSAAFEYNPELREVRVRDRVRTLSEVEDRLLRYLLSKPNQVCKTQELLDQVWGGGRTPSVVEKTVNRLREKVEEETSRPRVILAMRGEGYQLRLPKQE